MKKYKFKVGDRVLYESHNEEGIIAAMRDDSNSPYIVTYSKGWGGAGGKLIAGELDNNKLYHYVIENDLVLIHPVESTVNNNYEIF